MGVPCTLSGTESFEGFVYFRFQILPPGLVDQHFFTAIASKNGIYMSHIFLSHVFFFRATPIQKTRSETNNFRNECAPILITGRDCSFGKSYGPNRFSTELPSPSRHPRARPSPTPNGEQVGFSYVLDFCFISDGIGNPVTSRLLSCSSSTSHRQPNSHEANTTPFAKKHQSSLKIS